MRIRGTQKQVDDYTEDQAISPKDKVVGQESSFFKQTKSYSVQNIALHVRGGDGGYGQVLTNNGDGTWSFQGEIQVTTTTTTLDPGATTTTTAAPGTTTTTTSAPLTTTTTTSAPGTTTTTTSAPVTTTTTQAATTTTTTQAATTTTTTQAAATTTTTAAATTTTTTQAGTTTTTTAAATTTTTTTSGSNDTPGTLILTRRYTVKTINGISISERGYADNLTDITNFEGTAISTGESGFIQYDTSTPDVGTFIGDGYGGFITSANTHPSAAVLPWSFFSTPKYIHDVGAGLSGTFDPYPVYKVEQSNGYLKITQKITSSTTTSTTSTTSTTTAAPTTTTTTIFPPAGWYEFYVGGTSTSANRLATYDCNYSQLDYKLYHQGTSSQTTYPSPLPNVYDILYKYPDAQSYNLFNGYDMWIAISLDGVNVYAHVRVNTSGEVIQIQFPICS